MHSRGSYWDLINGRIPRRRFFSDKPMVPMSLLGPVSIPGTREAEKEETEPELSIEQQAEKEVRQARKASREVGLDAAAIASAQALLDAEAERKDEADKQGAAISDMLRAPSDHKMIYDKRFKEKTNE